MSSLILPGTFLGSIGGVTVDVLISRLLAAAFLAMAWGSFHGWRATERTQIRILLELEAVFAVLWLVFLFKK